MKARDLMHALTEVLKPDNTLTEATRLLGSSPRLGPDVLLKAMPVCDETGQLVGILSIGDILKAVYPPYMYFLNLAEFTWDGMVESFARRAPSMKVAQAMTAHVITVPEDATLMACVDQMLKNNVKRVPVMDRENRVAGMLFETDIFFEISRAMLDESGREKP